VDSLVESDSSVLDSDCLEIHHGSQAFNISRIQTSLIIYFSRKIKKSINVLLNIQQD